MMGKVGDEKRIYSTHDVARLCHVTPMTVIRWVEDGKLRAFKTAGGHRRVMHDELLEFMRARGLPPPVGENTCTLVVDSDAARRERLTARLREARPDFAVYACAGSFTAGRLYERLRPHVVFVEARASGSDAGELIASVRADAARVAAVAAADDARRQRPRDVDELVMDDAPASVLKRILAD
jgi:excisionase family DNA binding protein